ncbi:hypothetical protein THTE_4488 [Thermogutta terrifontis]|uniref:Uncharacterized protein n=1 Tax=Thermogutta terrifontis TaxID=1331910 RepID=A0A286RMA8_9BACT|nr:hypothetical protein THTE_4488 [Thermogutta terrifontis]
MGPKIGCEASELRAVVTLRAGTGGIFSTHGYPGYQNP